MHAKIHTHLKPDIAALRCEVLAALRGPLTQGQANRRLGYKFNQVSRWETGQVDISWLDLLRYAQLRDMPVDKLLMTTLNYLGAATDTAALAKFLLGSRKVTEAATATGLSRHVISRMVNGKAQMRFQEMAELLRNFSSYLDFFDQWIGIDRLPSLQELRGLQMAQTDLAYQYPFSGAIISWLHFASHHKIEAASDRWLAQKLRLPLNTIRPALAAMERAQVIIRKSPEKMYRINTLQFASVGTDRLKSKRLTSYWLARASDHLAKTEASMEKTGSLYHCFTAGPTKLKKIKALLQGMHEGVMKEVREESDEPADDVYVLCLAVLATSEGP